ncbi:MAG: hypothetical protein HYW49_07845 [Deltaproteobacteria bacterium]|nr:hypothetical protein [Deltaproteobacteria bacterium]
MKLNLLFQQFTKIRPNALRAFAVLFCAANSFATEPEFSLELKSQALVGTLNAVVGSRTEADGKFRKAFEILEARPKNIDLSKAPEIVKIYGSNLFGIELFKPIEMDLKAMGVDLEAAAAVEKIDFTQEKTGAVVAKIALRLESIAVDASEIWLKENGITHQVALAPDSCNKGVQTEKFLSNKLWAIFHDVKLQPRRRSAPLRITAEAVLDVLSKDGPQIALRSLRHSLVRTLTEDYALSVGTVEFPKIQIKVDGKCFPIDTKPVDAYFRYKLAELKLAIVKAAGKALTRTGVAKANEILAKLKVPTQYEYEYSKKFAFVAPKPFVTQPDHTRVVLSGLPREKTEEAPQDLLTMLTSRFFSLQYQVSLASVTTAAPDRITFGVAEHLEINGRSEQPPANGAPSAFTPPLEPSTDVLVSISKDFFVEKFELIRALKILEAEAFPAGISLDKGGIVPRILSSGKMALVAHVLVDLGGMEGFWPAVGYYVEKGFGDTGGVLKLPLQIDVEPYVSRAKMPMVGVKLALNRDYLGSHFGERANLDQAAGLIRDKVIEQLDNVASSLSSKKFEKTVAELTALSGLNLHDIHFSGDDVHVHADIDNPQSLIGKFK